MNEACQNLSARTATSPPRADRNLPFALNYMRDVIMDIQDETKLLQPEATPAEGTSYRLAKRTRSVIPILYRGRGCSVLYQLLTASRRIYRRHFETLELQDELQSLYTGGTVLHLYLGEDSRPQGYKNLIKIFTNYKLPYISITPTFSICNNHGYISGEHFSAPNAD